MMDEVLDRSIEAMRAEGLPELATRTFCMHLKRLVDGESGKLGRRDIDPVSEIADARSFVSFQNSGIDALNRVAMIKVNGGLGTGMGLERAKSLLPVRNGLSFLDLIARQVLALRRSLSGRLPVVFMNSFRTDRDTYEALGVHHDIKVDGLPLGFLQHKVPKILVDGYTPAHHPKDAEFDWCPPGHGDIYTALETSGLLDQLDRCGIDYVFLSNADNLGAVFDAGILGFMVENGVDFLLEAANRTEADRKGGHLCRLKNGRLALRESAQCPADEEHEFQDITLHRYFNTNNIWVHLPSLRRLLLENSGVLPMSTIVNHKNLDPRDPSSAKVIQLETAMGSALSLFPKAAAILVPRQRFSPVKTTNDLLPVRSDVYELSEDFQVQLHSSLESPPPIDLDLRYYKEIDDFEKRFPEGPPRLRRCSSLTIDGDIVFGGGVEIIGSVTISAPHGPARIERNVVVENDLVL